MACVAINQDSLYDFKISYGHTSAMDALRAKALKFLRKNGISDALLVLTETEAKVRVPFCGDCLPIFRIEHTVKGYEIMEDKSARFI